MLLGGYIKLARTAMRTSRWRSLLTMLGIIVGIVAVVTTVSIGEGVKQQITTQINIQGDDQITILPGKTEAQDAKTYFARLSPTAARAKIVFDEQDYQAVLKVPEVTAVTPFGHVAGEIKSRDGVYQGAEIIATSENLPKILNRKVEFGSFFSDKTNSTTNGAVIGLEVAEKMFGENVPLGRDFTIRGTRFIVQGVLEEFDDTSPLLALNDFDNSIFIQHRLGQELMNGNMQIYQILGRAKTVETTSSAIEAIKASLTKTRGSSDDFSVLKQSDTLHIAESTLTLLTSMIAGVAAISLLVGGIGIMNIMLVSVTERTREIGVRKAVGATNRQIMYQFLTEAAVLSIVGGILGVLMSLFANFMLRITTDLQPVITLNSMLIAVGVSFAVGIIFGVAPAAIAARKDPIESLRYQ